MAISLMCGPAFVSLEFGPEDRPAVVQAIRDLYGKAKSTPYVMSSVVTVDGEDFTYQNEWDDPCLLSSTARGADMLQAIADRLGHARI